LPESDREDDVKKEAIAKTHFKNKPIVYFANGPVY
jgi:hypothetical protein